MTTGIEHSLTIVFKELGSASSGRDCPWHDGTYRKMARIFRESPDPLQGWAYAHEHYPGQEVLDVFVSRPYSVTGGD